jgi:predicted DNA-binding transcriptional regulator AlpA
MTGSRSKSVRIVEIADILGVTHQRASKIVAIRGFPKPVRQEGQSRLWDRREVSAWARSGGAISPGADPLPCRNGTLACASVRECSLTLT